MSDMPTGKEPRTSGGPMFDEPKTSPPMPKKGHKLKRKPPKPASQNLVSITEDSEEEPATEYTPNSLRVNHSEFPSLIPESTPESDEEELSVDDDTPATAPKLKRNLPAKLTRNLPASEKIPVKEDDEHSTDFDEVWTSSVVSVVEDDTPALPTSSKVVGSEQPADLEAGVSEKDDSQTLWYERKKFWLVVISLLLLVVIIVVVVVVVVTNNKDEVSSSSPTASPTNAPTVFTCTVCPDGSAPGNPDTVLDGWGGFTCEQLDTVVSGSIVNTTDCKGVQDSVAVTCGCIIQE